MNSSHASLENYFIHVQNKNNHSYEYVTSSSAFWAEWHISWLNDKIIDCRNSSQWNGVKPYWNIKRVHTSPLIVPIPLENGNACDPILSNSRVPGSVMQNHANLLITRWRYWNRLFQKKYCPYFKNSLWNCFQLIQLRNFNFCHAHPKTPFRNRVSIYLILLI